MVSFLSLSTQMCAHLLLTHTIPTLSSHICDRRMPRTMRPPWTRLHPPTARSHRDPPIPVRRTPNRPKSPSDPDLPVGTPKPKPRPKPRIHIDEDAEYDIGCTPSGSQSSPPRSAHTPPGVDHAENARYEYEQQEDEFEEALHDQEIRLQFIAEASREAIESMEQGREGLECQ